MLIKDFYVFNMAIKSEVSIELLFVNANQMIYLYLFIYFCFYYYYLLKLLLM